MVQVVTTLISIREIPFRISTGSPPTLTEVYHGSLDPTPNKYEDSTSNLTTTDFFYIPSTA
jgi:hypothetical protein